MERLFVEMVFGSEMGPLVRREWFRWIGWLG